MAIPPLRSWAQGGACRTSPSTLDLRHRAGPGVVFGSGFGSLLTLLLLRNHSVFTEPVYPRGDSAANAIITEQAKHFDLLVGNYSRMGFSHPGPAFFYWQAFGEWLLHDLLRLVPAPWNGQWLAVLVLNSALVAATLAVLREWSDSWVPVALCGAAALLYFATHQNLLSSTWMPHVYLAPFLLFLTATASVAAGRTTHLWALALAGGLLLHGHAGFLLFVPVISVVALGTVWWRRRRISSNSRDWLLFGGVIALFLLPIAVNLVWHWPGEFAKYVGYGDKRQVHSAGATARYVLGFWPGPAVIAVVLAVVLATGLAWLALVRLPGDPRGLLIAGLGMGALATVLFAGYAAGGIDDLSQDYVGYFYWAVPMFLLLLAVLGLGGVPRLGRAAARLAAVAALVVALPVAVRSPAFVTAPENLPGLPRVMSTLSSYAAGRPLVVELEPGLWPLLTALVVEGDRDGQRVCARDPAWRFLVTTEFVCTRPEVAKGRPVRLNAQTLPGGTILGEMDGVLIFS